MAAWCVRQRLGFNPQSRSFQSRLGDEVGLSADIQAIRAKIGAQPTWDVNAEDETNFYHLDALGSVRAITDQTGALKERHNYFAFGEEYVPPATNPENTPKHAATAMAMAKGTYEKLVANGGQSGTPIPWSAIEPYVR